MTEQSGAVAVDVRGRQLGRREVLDLGQQRHRGVVIQVLVRTVPEDLVAAEDLEQVEEDVPQIRPVVAHRGSPWLELVPKLLVSNFHYATGG